MKKMFDLITRAKGEKGEPEECRLGIRVHVGGFDTVCPVTPSCRSYKAFETEVRNITKGLDETLKEAEKFFDRSRDEKMFGIEPHMKAEEVWSILSRIDDTNVFVGTFNRLEEEKRREIAEHVLTKCNVFSGKASVFSSRYNESTVLLE